VAGVERTALAAGVQLRVLQRLPHTAPFAAYMAAGAYTRSLFSST